MGRTALIVGAGIGGLAAGIALRRAGWQVRVFERAAKPRELGFALHLAPNAIVALRELGIGERLIADASVTGDVEVRRPDGRILRRIDVAAAMTGVPAVVALRPMLHGELLNEIEPQSLVLNKEAIGFEVAEEKVVLTFTDGQSETGNVLVGADGLGSVVRRCLRPEESPPRRSGYYGIRGVAHDAGHQLGNLSAVAYFGYRIEAATARAGKDAVYWYISLPAGDVPADLREPRAVVERCATLLDDGFRAIAARTRPEDLRLDELVDRDPIAPWGRGPVTLLGDAAHPMLPHTGQGAAQALEDAVALGLALEGEADPVTSLRRYERVRSRRTRRIVKRGRRLVKLMTTKSRFVDRLRATVIQIVPARALIAAYMSTDTTDPHRALRKSTARVASKRIPAPEGGGQTKDR